MKMVRDKVPSQVIKQSLHACDSLGIVSSREVLHGPNLQVIQALQNVNAGVPISFLFADVLAGFTQTNE